MSYTVNIMCSFISEISCKEEQLLHDYKQFKKGISMYNEYLQCYIIPHREDEFIITFNPPKKSATHSPCHVKFKITHSATSFQCKCYCPLIKNFFFILYTLACSHRVVRERCRWVKNWWLAQCDQVWCVLITEQLGRQNHFLPY